MLTSKLAYFNLYSNLTLYINTATRIINSPLLQKFNFIRQEGLQKLYSLFHGFFTQVVHTRGQLSHRIRAALFCFFSSLLCSTANVIADVANSYLTLNSATSFNSWLYSADFILCCKIFCLMLNLCLCTSLANVSEL